LNFQVFVCISALLVAASAAPSGPVVVGYGGGQTSHQSVSRPFGEQRSIVQSKAFGATHASVSQVDNSKGLSEIQPAHGANRPIPVEHAAVIPVVRHAVHTAGYHAAPLVHATPAYHVAPAYHAAPIVHASPAYHAPIVHAAPAFHAPIVHAAPAYHAPTVHAAPAYHAPIVHAAPAYHAPVVKGYAEPAYPDEPSPYTYTYAVADDYSKAAFNAEETADGAGTVSGSYSVALPDGRTQHVNYHANGYDGYVADVTYEGLAVYPDAPVYAAPVVHAAPAYQAATIVHSAPVVHAAPAYHAAPIVAHGPVVAAGYHARPAGQVSHQSVSKPYQGEHRSITQSKAFGASVAAVVDSPNRLHGANAVIAHPVAHIIG